ncbi:Glutarate-semialdehyde dehydrogenase DavD [Variovorax boronicumulans]|uniref:aldehyde dehydrogenase family protein n=1 Tax=Variovorax boronicumulans TaxID=436515 RepID=UPI000BB3D43B|nr:aldehyde dehydrogenase family protein [Variovorax boronicumulans]PBI87733.1 Glutarate-semialdehyde dehydrogenase DavD [Variovorax boronicumulans]
MGYKLLIDGELVNGAQILDVINPATGEAFAACARADAAQLEQAIAAAKRAFPAWSALSHEQRRAKLLALADAVQARAEEFARLLTLEQGKPLAQAEHEVGGAIAAMRTFADMDTQLKMLREEPGTRILQQRTPLGVVAAITPWNFPMLMLTPKIAPALITGNTVIAKPAPTTPLTTMLLGEVASTILPPGVLNIVVDANDLGGVLSRHPDVAKISFTGSTATGKKVMESGASTLKRLTLELGGNDAAIVLDDVDVSTFAPRVFQAAMLNAGQVCFAAKRIYVPSRLYGPMCDALAALARDAVVGDGLERSTQIGPIQNQMQYEKLLSFLDEARARGKVIAGGAPLDRPGYFIPPTIVRDIPHDARLVREEQFGPLMPILAYDSIDEVIVRANDSEYGLGGTIWTTDPERALPIAQRIDSGMVWINKHLDLPFDLPFGGAKSSGIGSEYGREGLEEFTQRKLINMAV